MTSAQAGIILELLDAGTDSNWPQVKSSILEYGYSPAEVIDAWKALEELAGMAGMAPAVEDFE